MKKLIYSSLIVLSLLTTYVSKAQDSATTKFTQKYKYGIGLGAGFTTGYGLSFKYLPKRFGVQVNFAPYSDSRTQTHSVGLTLIYLLIETKRTNLFLYQGNHYFYNSYLQDVFDQTIDPAKASQIIGTQRVTESYVNNGLGFGVQVFLGNRVDFNLMAGYAFYDNFNKINLTGEAALHYKF